MLGDQTTAWADAKKMKMFESGALHAIPRIADAIAEAEAELARRPPKPLCFDIKVCQNRYLQPVQKTQPVVQSLVLVLRIVSYINIFAPHYTVPLMEESRARHSSRPRGARREASCIVICMHRAPLTCVQAPATSSLCVQVSTIFHCQPAGQVCAAPGVEDDAAFLRGLADGPVPRMGQLEKQGFVTRTRFW